MKKAILIVAVLFVVIQFIPTSINEQNEAMTNDIHSVYTIPTDVSTILKTSCYDCHSNTSILPWYANIQPVKFYLSRHVKNGKKHLNFSEFANYDAQKKQKKLNEIVEEVEEHEMPLKSYTLIHTDAKLDEAKIKLLKDWVNASQQLNNSTTTNSIEEVHDEHDEHESEHE